ncbi:myxosortase-dependent M36 family metallopeptidase [Corallococcus sp. bb12-1]|uniref:myxosortase-dependent M36 family metallopeptidase n=1 Tax=Corallococcus sp. bb12-1 TaxID=2996784 RepID=UPI002271C986|nr:myxosortase-dependent M36 family metallopeptidase [Corallococcus sp. bb12-1]MCY1042751.1 myxosortase-dependent M36 family metallopeptidase [Corallococcus sp. bb12-1]
MRLREKLLTSLLLVPIAGTSAWAKERSNFDAFLEQKESRQLAVDPDTAVSRGLRVEQTEQRLGVPTFAWAAQDGAQSKSVIRNGMTAESAARAHLQTVADNYRLSRDDVSGATLRAVHNTGTGPIIATFNQTVGGIPVFRNEIKVIMAQDMRLVAVSGYLAPSDLTLNARLKARSASSFRLGAADALSGAFKDLTGSGTQATSFVNTGTQGEYTFFELAPSAKASLAQDLTIPARARQVFYTLADTLEPAWYVEVNAGPKAARSSQYFAYVVSATTGKVLFRNDLTSDAAGTPFTYKVWADVTSPYIPEDGPQGNDATPHPTGLRDGFQIPLNRPQHDITIANSPFTKNDPWLPANASQTLGNNVDAYADLVGPDGFTPGSADLRAETTGANTFGHVFDQTKAPNASPTQIKAAVVNLFYVNNFLHDWFYDAGFDEAAGNAQSFNFGRGGVEGDPIQAQGQDFGGRNNANMSTPADGASPRMQMYVFNGVPELSVTAPAALAGVYDSGSASFGKQVFEVTGDVVSAATNGCVAFPADTFTGKIAIIDRGACDFSAKALNAQNAGAIATVVANNAAGEAPGLGGTNAAVTIPTLSITLAAATQWRTELANGPVTVRMRRSADLDRDGTLDNGIIAHEWGHYISNRLIGNAAGLVNNQGRAMGEGWGDFHAQIMQVRESDRTKPGNANFQGVYTNAGYTSSGGRNNGYYFGIRRIPYSTDFAKNSLTFKHIANWEPLPAAQIAGAATGASNSQVHNSGEVWATMLWEAYASLLNAHPFQEAQDRMKRYLVAAYKATPNAPTYLEARDALWAVALASDPADYSRFVAAFAKRGAGFGAKAPDRNSSDHIGVVESFASGGNIEITSIKLDDSVAGCDHDGVLDVGEQGTLKVTVRNVGGGGLSSFTGTVSSSSTTATLAFPNGTTISVPALSRGAQATVSVPVNLSAVSNANARAGLKIVFDSPEIPAAAKTVTFDGRVNYDDVPSISNTESFESGLSAWTLSENLSSSGDFTLGGTVTNRFAHGYNPEVASELTLTSPWMTVAQAEDFTISYKYRHSFEQDYSAVPAAYDGAVLEFTVDGIDWIDPWDLYPVVDADPGYTHYISEGGGNPIEGRAAMGLTSAGFPAFTSASINFGTFFPDLELYNVRFRFRVGADLAVGAYGLDVDDVTFTGATPVFPSQAGQPDAAGACNLRPVANPGPSRVGPTAVAEGTIVGGVFTRTNIILNGSGSFDPDAASGDTLTYAWTQTGGATPVTLTDADTATPSFKADVDYSDTLAFQLVVTDAAGKTSVPKTVEIEIIDVNQAPVIAITAPATVNERDTGVTLDASGSTDADRVDQGYLTFAWTQTGGTPKVTLTGAATATARFTAPDVTSDTQLTFTVSVSDGTATVSKAVSVTVKSVDRAPVANAGADFTVDTRTQAALDGAGTDPDGDAVSLLWAQTTGPAVTLSSTTAAKPTFTAPDVATTTTLTFTLTASANGQTATDTVIVTVKGVDRAPTANAGVDITADERTNVTLAGSGEDADGDALTYQWEQLAGTEVTLTGATTAAPSFTAPDVSGTTTLSFKLTVTAAGKSATDTVNVTVKNVDRAPTANAGADFEAASRASATLNGSGADVDGDALSFHWEQTAGDTVTLTGADTASASFTTPDVNAPTELTFRLTVTAGGQSATDLVNVTVRKSNRHPVGEAPATITVNEGDAVELDASGITDPDGDALTFTWTQVGGSTVATTGAGTSKLTFTAPQVQADTALAFSLVAKDADGATAGPFVYTVTVKNVNQAPVAKARVISGVRGGELVKLDASTSTDPDNETLTYAWAQTGGSAASLTGANTAEASFTPAKKNTAETYTFTVTATDAAGATSTAEVKVNVPKFEEEDGGGCSSAGGSVGGMAPLMALFAAMGMLRRRKSA